MKQWILSLLITGGFITGFNNHVQAQADSAAIKEFIRKYEQSINQADTVLASKIWAQTAEVSFIHPRGTNNGWSGVKDVYKMFAENFSKRELHGMGEKISVYGDVAWLTFEWVFDATRKMNNQKIQTKGRETQILRKIDGAWKLVHIHYSGVPVTGEGQGF